MFLSLTLLKNASSVCQARRRTFPCLKLSVVRFQDFGNFHGCGFPNTRKEHDFLKSLKHELFIIMKTSG